MCEVQVSDTADEERGGEQLLERVDAIARALSETEGLDATLQLVVDLSEDYLEACDGASLMIVQRGGRVFSPAYSSKVAYDSDQAQYATDESPCLEAIREHHTVIIDDLETDERWPDYRERALELGVRSMISFRLFIAGDTMGALNLYSADPHAFGERSKVVGQVFASHAAVAMKSAIEVAGLQAALETRDVIGQAKGIIMEREQITASEAFERLRGLSQASNRRLRDLAADIAESGDIPRDPAG